MNDDSTALSINPEIPKAGKRGLKMIKKFVRGLSTSGLIQETGKPQHRRRKRPNCSESCV